MIERKKKLRIIQLSLLIVGSLIILFTYTGNKNKKETTLISKSAQEKIEKQLAENELDSDIFYNIEYSGLDLSGNRYILKTKEAFYSNSNQEIVNMKFVEAFFYFKDDTILYIWSDSGIYNNRTLDMQFKGNVKAKYEKSELFAQKAEYSNSKSFLIISDTVKVKDSRGTVFADKLLFDIKKQTLNIASINENKINANINLK